MPLSDRQHDAFANPAKAQYLKDAAKNLLINHSHLKEIGVIGPDHMWEPLGADGQRIRSKVHEKYKLFSGLLAALFQTQPESVRRQFQKEAEICRELINQHKLTFTATTEKAFEKFGKAIDKQLSFLNGLPDSAEGEHIYVPDTNALLYCPELEDWGFEGLRTRLALC